MGERITDKNLFEPGVWLTEFLLKWCLTLEDQQQELTVSSRGLHCTKCNGYLMGEIIVDQTGFRTLDLLLGALTTDYLALLFELV